MPPRAEISAPSEAPVGAQSTNWDLTRFGILLYLLGLLTSLVYYGQFGIFSVEILRPQCVLIGALMSIIYALWPLLVLHTTATAFPKRLQLAAALTAFAASDAALFAALLSRFWTFLGAALTCLLLQLLLYTGRFTGGALVIDPTPRVARIVVLMPLLAVHYATFVHPSVPGYFGGGKPLTVTVYSDPQDLPASRFVRSKNRDRANQYRDSYRLHLLYETPQDYYFVEPIRSTYGLEGYEVTRLAKLRVLRIDYLTPTWISMEGVR